MLGLIRIELVNKIVQDISRKLKSMSPNDDTKNLVGIDGPVKQIESLFHLGLSDVRIIGLWGMVSIVMQSRKVLRTWRIKTVENITRQILEFPVNRGSTTLGRPIRIETQCRRASHRCCRTRNHTELSCFSSGQFQGFLIQFLCLF